MVRPKTDAHTLHEDLEAFCGSRCSSCILGSGRGGAGTNPAALSLSASTGMWQPEMFC